MTKKTDDTAPKTVKEAIDLFDGQAFFRYNLNRYGIKLSYPLVNGWIKANTVPLKWRMPLENLYKRHPDLFNLSLLRPFYGKPRALPRPLTIDDCPNKELYRYVIHEREGVTKFVKYMAEHYGDKVQPYQVYQWLKEGFVSDYDVWQTLRGMAKVPLSTIGHEKPKPKRPRGWVSPERRGEVPEKGATEIKAADEDLLS